MTSSAGTTMRSELPDMMALPSLALSPNQRWQGASMGRAGFAFSLSIKGLEVSAGGTWRTVLHPCNSRPADHGVKPAGEAPGAVSAPRQLSAAPSRNALRQVIAGWAVC